ncbi:MAG: hypothetical protein NC037_06555 [Bacteroides sp.]|nr:hypothetical protein [Bacillota bacterium]MCM1393523.1 hypothetical protein [[Eubacterium] siraeum]MCM1456165.1 hypothetical protein [Bacteroides sp.]
MAKKKNTKKSAQSRASAASSQKKHKTQAQAKPTSQKKSEPKKPATTAPKQPAKPAKSSQAQSKPSQKKSSKTNHVGEIWRGETKYIDPEPKKQRNYVVVVDDGKNQTVSKLKSIKIFDENGKNADKALVEINATRYGLERRTGVDSETFSDNRMSGKRLKVSDKDVFPEEKPRAKLGSRDKSRVLRHTGRLSKQKSAKNKR